MPEQSPSTLLRTVRSPAPLTLGAALQAAEKLGLEYALLYGVGKGTCMLCRVSGASLLPPPGGAVPQHVFEARAFGPDAELRWLATNAGAEGTEPTGEAALLVEGDPHADPAGWKQRGEKLARLPSPSPATAKAAVPPDQYLLWGRARSDGSGGWTELFEHRVGSFMVPVEVSEGDRVVLTYVEYVDQGDEHGNCSVAAERLVGLACLEPRQGVADAGEAKRL